MFNAAHMNTFVQSYPHTVVFEGFTSTTLDLQRAGWQIAMERIDMRYSIRLALHHPNLRLYARTSEVDVPQLQRFITKNGSPLIFKIMGLYSDIKFQLQNIISGYKDFSEAFTAIDCTPHLTEVNMSEMNIFRPIDVDENVKLWLDEKTVMELQEEILKKQTPEMKEINERMKKRELREEFYKQNPIKQKLILVA